jgi:hypothetical protein
VVPYNKFMVINSKIIIIKLIDKILYSEKILFFNHKNLFSSKKDDKIKNLMRSIDNTNYRFGRSTLSLASAGINKKWNIKKQYSSKIDTADFNFLPTIKAI